MVSFISLFDKNAVPHKEMLGLMVKGPHIKPQEFGKINVPTLAIVGTNDMIKEKHSRLIAESIYDSKFAMIDCNHFIASKNSQSFNNQISDFLKR